MPVMDGAALIRSLHKMGARAKSLAVSGLVERERMMVSVAAPGAQVEFLANPFSTEKLLTVVREVLQKPGSAAGSAPHESAESGRSK
jgi:FixJ family two-component response regulator